MTEKFIKIEREYCLGDSSVNVYGYRLLTSGFRQDMYAKNPIGFDMHKDRDKGVLVRWEDLRVDGDKIYGKPVINLYHPDGQKTVDEINAGFKNAASMGKIIVIEATDDEKLKLKDQTGPTVTEWYPREISFVDIPGNHNALANLYDINDNELDLSDLSGLKNTKNTKKEDMSKVILTAAMLSLMDLTDQSSEVEVSQKLQDLADTAAKVPALERDLADKSTALTAKEQELADLKASTIVKEVEDLIAKGQADKKLTVEVANKLKTSFADNPTGLKDLIDAMPAQTLVTGGGNGAEAKDLASFEGQGWDDLYASGKLEQVRQKFPDLYEKLKNEKFTNKD
jgi:hypothetical protein